MIKVVAISADLGFKLCGSCALIEADAHGLKPWDIPEWEPMTTEDLASEGQHIFSAIREDAIHSYPEFVSAGIDPFFVAQMDAVPYCERCGLFLARLESPTIRRGGDR